MNREQQLDWLCRLRSEIYVYMPQEWIENMDEALTQSIKALSHEPCDDAISRDAVLEIICRETEWYDIRTQIEQLPSVTQKPNFCASCKHYADNEICLECEYDGITRGMTRYESVTQKPKTGHWIRISPAEIYECSECGQNVMTGDICAYMYCHGCGARMERSGEE